LDYAYDINENQDKPYFDLGELLLVLFWLKTKKSEYFGASANNLIISFGKPYHPKQYHLRSFGCGSAGLGGRIFGNVMFK
jgi:hypothetical protein